MPTEKRSSLPHGLGSNKRSRSNADLQEKEQAQKPKASVFFELEEDADRIDEIKAMFEAAESVLDDPKKCIPLLRGAIHECTALENGEEVDGEGVSDSQDGVNERATAHNFPARFYRIFAESLYYLAILEHSVVDDEVQDNGEDGEEKVDMQRVSERNDFLKAAKRKVDEGLEENPDEQSLLACRALVTCALAANDDSFAALELTDHTSSYLEALDAITDDHTSIQDMVDFITKLLDCKSESVNPSCTKRIVQTLLSVFEDFLEDYVESEDQVSLLKLGLMNSLAEAELEVGEGEQVQKFLPKSINVAEEFLESHQDSQLRGDFVCAIGESHMLLGSAKALAEDDTGEVLHSQKAVEKFEAAKELGVTLDQAIEEFIADVKGSIQVKTENGAEDFAVISATQ